MPRLSKSLPEYRHHAGSGQAVVTLDGKSYYLGRYKSRASKAEYDRLTALWLAHGRRLPATECDLTIQELQAAFWQHADQYYRKDGEPTGELDNIRYALRPLQALYGPLRANDFGPVQLKAIQQHLVAEGKCCRKQINARIGKIRRMFKWAVSEGKLRVEVFQALLTVEGLRKGRTTARETPRVRPVADDVIKATLPFMAPIVADMVRLQRLLGCRPSEICNMRPVEIDRSAEVWQYRPSTHKSEHLDQEKVIRIGPRARRILDPYLRRDPMAYCFSPREADQQRREKLRANRKSAVQPSQRGRRGRSGPIRQLRDRYTVANFRQAIRRACEEKAGLNEPSKPKAKALLPAYYKRRAEFSAASRAVRWSPNRLRHTAATAISAQFGIQTAKAVLGHSKVETTAIYAEADAAAANEAARRIG